MIHLAHIICGSCGTTTTLALGKASAITCSKCKVEIVLGEAPLPGDFKDPTLNVVLDSLGFSHAKAPMERNPTGGRHDVFDWGGTLVVTADAHGVWGWLKSEGHYPRAPKGDLKEQADLPGER